MHKITVTIVIVQLLQPKLCIENTAIEKQFDTFSAKHQMLAPLHFNHFVGEPDTKDKFNIQHFISSFALTGYAMA